MRNSLKPPRKKKPEKRSAPAEAEGIDGNRQQPAAAERTDGRIAPEPIERTETPSTEDSTSKFTQPVTNHDEQDKITNVDGSDIPQPAK